MDHIDTKISLIAIIWTITNIITYIYSDINGLLICNAIWFVLLVILVNFPPFLRWFHKR